MTIDQADNHDNVTSRFSGMFNDFLTAAKAMEQLPQLEAKVAAAEAERDQHKAHADTANAHADMLADQVRNLQSKIASLEASLDAISKSKSDVEDRLHVVMDTIHGIGRHVSDTVALVEPPPVPTVPAPAAQAGPADGGTTEQPDQGEGKTEDQSDSHPTSTPSGEQGSGPTASGETGHSDSGQSTTHPTQDANATSPNASEVANSAYGPFASSTEGQSPDVASVDPFGLKDQATGTPSPASPSTDASRRSWYLKPDNRPWDDWIADGNDAPPWMKQQAS